MVQINTDRKAPIICTLILYRLVCWCLTRNYDYPDQHWQGPQIGHLIHYSYGYQTWQWTIPTPLRNPIYPYLLSLSYYMPVPTDYIYMLPQLLIQIPLAIAADYSMLKILGMMYGGKVSWWMLVGVFGNWGYAVMIVRTYANSFQACLCLVGVGLWIGNGIGGSGVKDVGGRVLAVLAYVGRPTSIVIWAILWPYQLYRIAQVHSPMSRQCLQYILKNLKTLTCMVISSLVVGSVYNGKVTLTEYNFIKYNFIEKWSHLYGEEPFYFYFVITVPFFMGGLLLPILDVLVLVIRNWGTQRQEWTRLSGKEEEHQKIKQKYKQKQDEEESEEEEQDQDQEEDSQQSQKQRKKERSGEEQIIKILTICSTLYLVINSLSTHKEHRFILPILPFLLVLSTIPISNNKFTHRPFSFLPAKLVWLVSIVISMLTLVAFNSWGKSDGVTAWRYIRHSMEDHEFGDRETAVVVMGEMHFMVGVAALHRNVTYRIPDASAIKMAANQSQNMLLQSNPQLLYSILTSNRSLKPTYIIAQGKYLPHTSQILIKQGYQQTKFWRHCTILQEIFFGFDSISIFQPIHRQSVGNGNGNKEPFLKGASAFI